MPIHDWTRVESGIFHHFHHEWISEIQRALNHGLLPSGYYALAEQIARPFGPDVLTLRSPGDALPRVENPGGGVALATLPPKVRFRSRLDIDVYAAKAKAVSIRHVSDHQIIALVEIVSPGNKSSKDGLSRFVRKAQDALASGIHLLIVDVFPPGPRDPEGIHRAICEAGDTEFVFSPELPLTCASYIGGMEREAFVEPVAVGGTLPEMPLFLTEETYVPLNLESTYRAAWNEVPAFWRNVISKTIST